MEPETKKPLSHRSRSGSEKRQKGKLAWFRTTTEDYALLEAAALAEGLTVGSYIRAHLPCWKTGTQVRGRRRPLADAVALRPFYIELRHIGGNLNQIAYVGNIGKPADDAILEMKDSVLRTLAGLRLAMGMEG